MSPQPPKEAIAAFVAWAEDLRTSIGWPVMVAFPAAFDAMWVEWYCARFAGASPFRRRCIDLRTLVMVAMGAGYREGGKSSLPQAWREGTGAHTHLAVDDAVEQGRLFFRIVRELGVQRGDVALALEPPARIGARRAGATVPRRYPTMIRTVRRGATREALAADLARIEALEASDAGWCGVTEPAKHTLRRRIEHLDRAGCGAEVRLDDLPLDPTMVV